jgi:hypothetical protein
MHRSSIVAMASRGIALPHLTSRVSKSHFINIISGYAEAYSSFIMKGVNGVNSGMSMERGSIIQLFKVSKYKI